MLTNVLDRLSFISLFLTIVLLPIFALPLSKISVSTSKSLLIVTGLAISVICWCVARFSDGKINLPRSSVTLAGLGVVIVFLLSSFFSSASSTSFFGTIFDLGTFWFVFAAFVLMFVASMIVRDSKSARPILIGVMVANIIVIAFQILRFFNPEFFSLGILGGKTDNLVGSFNALGIMAGFLILSSIFLIEFFAISKKNKTILGLTILVSLFLVASVNFMLVWKLLGVFALMIFVYKISYFKDDKHEGGSRAHFPAFSFSIIIISLLFFMSGHFIGNFLPGRLGVSSTEVSPTFRSTLNVTRAALKNDPLLGIGPNRFGELWAMHKSASINSTIFWDTYFSLGSGLLPTLAATTGYLGILSLLIFFVCFLLNGGKALFSRVRGNVSREMAIYFILALYLFIASFFYASGVVVFMLAFGMAGAFIGLFSSREKGHYIITFQNDHRKSFFFILGLVIIMVLSAGVTFKYLERFASVPYFAKALQSESFPDAEASIKKAMSLNANDVYMRTYTQIFLVKLNSLANKGTQLTEAEKVELKSSFTEAENGAKGAVTYNPSNYLNHLVLGNVYHIAGNLGVEGAYGEAIRSYQQAATLNPLNPGIAFSIARAYFSDGNITEAKTFGNSALTMKPDYLEVLIFLSQIARVEGNTTEAINFAERAIAISPNDENLVQYLNSLRNGSVQ